MVWVLLFTLIQLSGCTLLFVQRGGSRVSSEAPTVIPVTASLQSSDATQGPRDGFRYKSAAGDTLESVARAFYGDSRQAKFLAKVNHLSPKALLKPDQKIRIPPNPPALPAVTSSSGSVVSNDSQVGLKRVTVVSGKNSYEMEVSDAKRMARPRVNRAFAPGENLKFAVRYFSVLGGYATLSVEALETYQGRPCYRLAAEAHSAFPFSNFFKVDDRMVSRFDAVDYFPWRFEKNVREGGYREAYAVDYRPLARQALRTKAGDPPKIFAVPPFVQDVISAFYYFRLLDFKVGDRMAVPTQAGLKNYELVVEVLKRETIRVEAGQFDCFLLKPHVKYDNVFQNKGDILLWVTTDNRRMPVKIQSKILIGNVNIELIQADLPRLDG
jgi:LysM repeat protein